MAFRRFSSSGEMIVVMNFTDNRERTIEINGSSSELCAVLNSDSTELGGNGRGGVKNRGQHLLISVPPLSALIVKCDKNKKIPFFEKAIDYSFDV